MNRKVTEWIDRHRGDMIATLQSWVRQPSVKAAPAEGAPFGPDIRKMLDLAMKDLKDSGFAVRDFDGYACDATLGGDEDPVAVLGHLDVVPVGDGWTREPFGAALEGTRMYGRGTNDDKGPVVAALYAMKAIRETGVPLKKGIRMILGCDEECGWSCMKYYAAHTTMPETGFSPDASFPLINTEKGMLRLSLRFPAAEDGLRILQMATGERPNVIAGESQALLAGGEEMVARIRAFAEKTGLSYHASATEKGVWVTATGIAGHAAIPEGRRSAIGMMLLLLRELGATGGIALLADRVGLETDGASLGCARRDEVSGALTNNMGILRLENGEWYGTFDLRCPVTADLQEILRTVQASLPGIRVEADKITHAHHVPADSPLVTELLAAYEEESGLKGKAMAIGGGTYAKTLHQGVAFGPLFPDEEETAHLADEYQDMDRLVLAAKIYANALLRLTAE